MEASVQQGSGVSLYNPNKEGEMGDLHVSSLLPPNIEASFYIALSLREMTVTRSTIV